MQKNKFRFISIIIGAAVMITVLVQGYWNYQNYLANKENFIKDVQSILDNSVEKYYSEMAKTNLFKISHNNIGRAFPIMIDSLTANRNFDTVVMGSGNHSTRMIKQMTQGRNILTDSSNSIITINLSRSNRQPQVKFADLAAKVIVSLEQDSLKLSQIDSTFRSALSRNKFFLDYELLIPKNIFDSSTFEPGSEKLILTASSNYLPSHTSLTLRFSNNMMEVFRRGLVGMMVSFITAMCIVGALVYLYQTIKNQKELAEIKDDLISNITHEFKTPIATVMSALEAIDRFNDSGDPEKTKKYLSLSNTQLHKLNGMVEKLLETSMLSDDQISLRKETVDISDVVKSLIENYRALAKEKTITLESTEEAFVNVDIFHFENVIGNLIDNAVKYGGETINVKLKKSNNRLHLTISNDGAMIPKAYQNSVFEKFFRVPSGNQHDIKGYGIGLYYAKTIIEKHGGKLSLASNDQWTTFELWL